MLKHSSWLAGLVAALVSIAGTRASNDDADVQALAAKIDEQIGARLAADKVPPAPRADDAEFLRRVNLDLTGRIPSVNDVREFLQDRAPDKRRRLVERLLESPPYVTHFTHFWRALLLPEFSDSSELVGYGAGLENWLQKRIADNIPYDQLVREVVTYRFVPGRVMQVRDRTLPEGNEPSPEAFYLSREVKPENLAAGTARLFLGVRLECAQCHNHPFARWKREQFWGYAAFFAGLQRQSPQESEGPGTAIREAFDRRQLTIPGSSQVVAAVFLDGREPRWTSKVGTRVTLADWMTAGDNRFFARAAANRLWGYFLGAGLVDPVDDLEGEHAPSHPELLDELARQLVSHRFDLKFLMRAITASRAYQASSLTTHPGQDAPQRFARMAVRGLTAEQIFDSVLQATRYQEPRRPDPPLSEPRVNSIRSEFRTRFAGTAKDKSIETQTSILQALALMNGQFMAELTSLTGTGTLATLANDRSMTTPQRVETLFLATLSRKPTAAENDRLVKYVESGGPDHDKNKALADVFWALLNSGEFILNH